MMGTCQKDTEASLTGLLMSYLWQFEHSNKLIVVDYNPLTRIGLYEAVQKQRNTQMEEEEKEEVFP